MYILQCVFRKMVWLQPVQWQLQCWWWITKTQLVNSQAPKIAVYLCMYLRASFHCSCVNCGPHSSLVLPDEQTGSIAATKLIWTAIILNGSEASGPLTNPRALKMYSWAVYKTFWGQKGVQANPLELSLPTGLIIYTQLYIETVLLNILFVMS